MLGGGQLSTQVVSTSSLAPRVPCEVDSNVEMEVAAVFLLLYISLFLSAAPTGSRQEWASFYWLVGAWGVQKYQYALGAHSLLRPLV
jgi:hypothetical protein